MNRKAVSGMMWIVLLIGMLSLTFNIQPAKASGTVYIRADGSVDPPTAPIQRDGDVYTFTGNPGSIVVERDNIVVDGAGYTVGGAREGYGIDLSSRSNVTLKNVEVTNFRIGILLSSSSNNTLTGNTASNNKIGIYLGSSSNNTISGNTASENEYGVQHSDGIYLGSSSNNTISGNTAYHNYDDGIHLELSSNNTLVGNTASSHFRYGIFLERSSKYNVLAGNTVSNNRYSGIHLWDSSNNVLVGNTASSNYGNGIGLRYSSNNTLIGNTASNNYAGIFLASSYNTVFHNNLINNTGQASVITGTVNIWDDGYPSGGNYWSDYPGVDADGDGIGDTPYTIDADNQDNYPLMAPISVLDAGTWNGISYSVDVISNSTVSDFYFNPDEGAFIRFNVTGEEGTIGYCRVAIPKQLLWVEEGEWIVLVGDEPVVPTVTEDASYTYLYFTYSHSTKTVKIIGTHVIPEFPSTMFLSLVMIVTLIVVVLTKRKVRYVRLRR